MKLVGVLALATACRPAPPSLDSCKDELGGVWTSRGALTPSGEPRRYDVVDLGRAIEIYPMFDDSVLSPSDRKLTTPDAVIVAPAAFDLTRTSDGAVLIGAQTRRFQRGPQTCVEHSPARIATCTGDLLELVQAPLAAPTDWDHCTAPASPPITLTLHREHD